MDIKQLSRERLQQLYEELLEAVRTGKRGQLLSNEFKQISAGAFEELRSELWGYVRTMLPGEREAANQVVRPILDGFSRLESSLEGGVIKTVLSEKDFAEKRKLIEERFEVATHHAWTLTATGSGAVSEAKRIEDARAAGYTHFKFVGPVPERPFCQQHFGKTYSLDEIKALNNGHGLSPLYYRGGYNCRHTWAPVLLPGEMVIPPAANNPPAAEPVPRRTRTRKTPKAPEPVKPVGTPLQDLPRPPVYYFEWKKEEAKKTIQKFLKDSTLEEFTAAFDPGIDGITTKLKELMIEDEDKVYAEFQYYDVNGVQVGRCRREFKTDPWEDVPKPYVYHAYFSLDASMQNKGIAKKMFQNSIAFYDKIGIDQVKVHADCDKGKYTWAQFGFQFSAINDRSSVANFFKSYFIIKVEPEQSAAIVREIDKLQTPQEFANFKTYLPDGTMVTGKELMLEGNSWHGTLDLSQGSASREIFNEYVHFSNRP